jgi:uncharacterized protein with HEPN domain
MFDMPRDDAARIQDIRESCDRISRFVAQMNFEMFRTSETLQMIHSFSALNPNSQAASQGPPH